MDLLCWLLLPLMCLVDAIPSGEKVTNEKKKISASSVGRQYRPFILFGRRGRRSLPGSSSSTKNEMKSKIVKKHTCVDLDWVIKKLEENERKRELWNLEVLKRLEGLWNIGTAKGENRRTVNGENYFVLSEQPKSGDNNAKKSKMKIDKSPGKSEKKLSNVNRMREILQSIHNSKKVDIAHKLSAGDSSQKKATLFVTKRQNSTNGGADQKSTARVDALKARVGRYVDKFVDELLDAKKKNNPDASMKQHPDMDTDILLRQIQMKKKFSAFDSNPGRMSTKKDFQGSTGTDNKLKNERLEQVIDLMLKVLE